MAEKFKDEEILIRPATKEDMVAVAEMVQVLPTMKDLHSRQYKKMKWELADFQNMSDGPKSTAKDLQRDGFERQPPSFRSIVAEVRGGDGVASGAVVGYVVYYETYSTWVGRTMMLQDFYVRTNLRRKGIGRMLFDAVAKEASLSGCSRLDLHVLEWNPACAFYEAKGAVNLTKNEHWCCYRLTGDALHKLAN